MNWLRRFVNWLLRKPKPKALPISQPEPHTGLVKKPYVFHREESGVERRPRIKRERTRALHSEHAEMTKEELARHHWLPKPKTQRKTTTRIHQPPAERHRKAISRIMSKRGGRTSSRYRKTIRESASIPIEEEND